MKYNDKAIYLDSTKPRNFFPERFSNEIYYSKLRNLSGITYESNFSIKFCLDGIENYIAEGDRKVLHKGEYLLVNEGMHVSTDCNRYCEGLSIFLDPELIGEVAHILNNNREDKLLDAPFFEAGKINFYSDIFSANDGFTTFLTKISSQVIHSIMTDAVINPNIYYEIAETLIVSQLNVNRVIERINKQKRSTREEIYKRVNKAIRFIDRNLYHRFSLDEISRACFMSKYHLIRTFKQVTGTTPFDYYNRKRMGEALVLIQSDTFSLNEVSRKLNFNDLSAFSNAFKKHFGTSPTNYPD